MQVISDVKYSLVYSSHKKIIDFKFINTFKVESKTGFNLLVVIFRLYG